METHWRGRDTSRRLPAPSKTTSVLRMQLRITELSDVGTPLVRHKPMTFNEQQSPILNRPGTAETHYWLFDVALGECFCVLSAAVQCGEGVHAYLKLARHKTGGGGRLTTPLTAHDRPSATIKSGRRSMQRREGGTAKRTAHMQLFSLNPIENEPMSSLTLSLIMFFPSRPLISLS